MAANVNASFCGFGYNLENDQKNETIKPQQTSKNPNQTR